MKKIFFCLTLFVLMTLSASAQFRIEAGTSIGGFRGTPLNYRAKAGITAGAFYDIGFRETPYEFLAVGLQYVEHGYDANGMDSKASWIQLPVESHTRIAFGDKFSMAADIGLFFGYAISTKTNFYYDIDRRLEAVDLSGSVSKFNFGTTLAVGLGLGRFSLRCNWQRGLLNLMGPTPGRVFSTNNYKTSSVLLVLGCSF